MSKRKVAAYPFSEMTPASIAELRSRLEQVPKGTPQAQVMQLLAECSVPPSVGESGGPAHRIWKTYFLSRRVLLTIYEDGTAKEGPRFVGFELSGLH